MSNNRTFFKNAQQGSMTLKDIFSDVTRKHTPEESARVLIAGTSLTTPDEADMLAGWQKPFLFARFGLVTLICMVMFGLLGGMAQGANDAFLLCMSFMIPMVLLILTWEMNIPRSISLMEVLKVVAIGGGLSLIFAIAMFMLNLTEGFFNAPIAEEPAKFAVVYILLKRKNRKYILEGMLLGMAVGTGFAVVETFGYIMGSARDGLIDACMYAFNNSLDVTYGELYSASHQEGLRVAVLRAFNAFAGHGFYAALYSGGLMIAKGAEPVNPKHLLSKSFLICFAISCVLHGLNNAPITSVIFPDFEIGGYTFWTYSVVQTIIAVVFLLGMMKRGVNQVIQVTIAHHGGRVTRAVQSNGSDAPVASGSAAHSAAARLEFVAGDMAGQSFGLQEGKPVTIGRHPNCQICVNVFSVSSCHLSVALRGNMVVVTDQGSTNGTYVGKQRLAPQRETIVPDGTVVYLGNQNCAFRVHIR